MVSAQLKVGHPFSFGLAPALNKGGQPAVLDRIRSSARRPGCLCSTRARRQRPALRLSGRDALVASPPAHRLHSVRGDPPARRPARPSRFLGRAVHDHVGERRHHAVLQQSASRSARGRRACLTRSPVPSSAILPLSGGLALERNRSPSGRAPTVPLSASVRIRRGERLLPAGATPEFTAVAVKRQLAGPRLALEASSPYAKKARPVRPGVGSSAAKIVHESGTPRSQVAICRDFRVGDTGLEPVTSALSRRRSPS